MTIWWIYETRLESFSIQLNKKLKFNNTTIIFIIGHSTWISTYLFDNEDFV